MRKATIVIPTYNEKSNVEMLIKKINDIIKNLKNWNISILVVDSKSPDNTSIVIQEMMKKYKNLNLLETEKEGMGKAYTKGFKYALRELDPYVIFEMDADLSHDPEMIPYFLEEIEKGSDFVIGSRYIKGGSIPKDWAFHRKLFSVIGNIIIRLGFAKFKITDWTSGYRAIKAWIIKDSVDIIDTYSGYVFQVAVLDNALKKMSAKENPDYRGSIKESISAVETLCQIISSKPKATLSSALDEIEKSKVIKLHQSIRDGFKKLYGWTSDDQGIRHGLKEEPNLKFHDAKYMLITCSAFINYLISKADQAGIDLSKK